MWSDSTKIVTDEVIIGRCFSDQCRWQRPCLLVAAFLTPSPTPPPQSHSVGHQDACELGHKPIYTPKAGDGSHSTTKLRSYVGFGHHASHDRPPPHPRRSHYYTTLCAPHARPPMPGHRDSRDSHVSHQAGSIFQMRALPKNGLIQGPWSPQRRSPPPSHRHRRRHPQQWKPRPSPRMGSACQGAQRPHRHAPNSPRSQSSGRERVRWQGLFVRADSGGPLGHGGGPSSLNRWCLGTSFG